MDKGTFYDLLDKYMNNGLNESETKQLNMLMEKDSTLREEFEFQKQVKSAVVINERKKKIAELDSVRDRYREGAGTQTKRSEAKVISLYRKYAMYAVAAMILIIPSIFLLQQDHTDEYQPLYSQNTNVSIKPKAGKLGAAPMKSYHIEILCCTEDERAEMEGDSLKLYLSEIIELKDPTFEIEGDYVIIRRLDEVIERIAL